MKNKSNIIKSIPFMFEKNIGQHKNESKFIIKNSSSTIYFLNSQIVLALIKAKKEDEEKSFDYNIDNKRNNKSGEVDVNSIIIKIENANKNTTIEGLKKIDCHINYVKGNLENKWSSVPAYEKIVYRNIYEGIDLVYYGTDGTLEYDFIVSPNGEVENIKLSIDGANKLEIDEEGNLLITINNNTIKMLKPKVYQLIDNKKVEIESNFILDNNTIKFNVLNYDKSKELVIDPPLLYGTYIGGTDSEVGTKVAIDSKEYAYVTGWTYSVVEFPLLNPYQGTLKGYCDAFLIKIDTKLVGAASLKYATYIGGSQNDYGYCVAVDSRENAYVVGYTESIEDFPLKNSFQSVSNAIYQGFLIKLDTRYSGDTSLKYSTYIGGNNGSFANGVAVDNNEYAYVTGNTNSNELFPIKDGIQTNLLGYSDAFLIKVNTKAVGVESLLYGTYIGGNNQENGNAVAVDSKEVAYITGDTNSTEQFPLFNSYQNTLNGELDAFLIKIDTKKVGIEGLIYGSYLGGENVDSGIDIAIDSYENAYIVGYTYSTQLFPIKNAYQDIKTGEEAGFLIKIDTAYYMLGQVKGVYEDSNVLKYGTYICSDYIASANGVEVDEDENAYVVGYTIPSVLFPLKYPFNSKVNMSAIGYLVKYNTKAVGKESLRYGTYVGGNNMTFASGVAIDKKYNAYITGVTDNYNVPVNYSTDKDFPLKNGFQDTLNGYSDAFLVKLNTLSCDISIEKSTCLCKACLNNKVPYTITITNKGPDKSTNIVLTDILPDTLRVESFIATTGSAGKSGNKLAWKIPVLEVGQSETLKIVVTLNKTLLCLNNKAGEYIINTINVTSDNTILNYYSTIDTDILYVDCNCL